MDTPREASVEVRWAIESWHELQDELSETANRTVPVVAALLHIGRVLDEIHLCLRDIADRLPFKDGTS